MLTQNINHNFLTSSQSEMFAEVITDSLRISERKHLFSWLQGSFQAFLGHEIMVCAIRESNSETYYFDSYTSTRYFTHGHLEQATKKEQGFISRAMKAWEEDEAPLLISSSLIKGYYGDYTVPFEVNMAELRDSELINMIAHGVSNNEKKLVTFFAFSRLTEEVNPKHAYMLELLLPHLHFALNRITSHASKASMRTMPTHFSRPITSRESEVLSWVQLGKTNWEIAAILAISPLTVKNHIQNILRKLDVQNRSQAARKANMLGLVKANG